MVWYFISVCIINRTLHGCLEIWNFSSHVEKIFHSFAALTCEIFFNTRREISYLHAACNILSMLKYIFKPKKTTRLSTHWVPNVNTKWKSSTLTILSHPADTMMGLLEFGENLTQDTHSVCPSSCWWTKDKSSLNMSVRGNVVLRRTIGHCVYFLTTPAVIIRVKEFVYCQLKVQWIPALYRLYMTISLSQPQFFWPNWRTLVILLFWRSC